MPAENDTNPIPPVTRDDPAAHSGDVVGENVAALKSLFPSIVTDGKVDFDVLRQLLGDEVEEGAERYGLNWKGKARARAFALTPSLGTLRPAKVDSKDWDNARNIMIEGDNLEVLKLLRKSYAGKVKLIYIDPPYNTGKDFVYPDNYTDSLANYEALTGQRGEDGARMTSNKEASGRFHTDWLNMMYPRLMLAKELLRDDGVIFVSCDSNELSNLLAVFDQLNGSSQRLGTINVISNPRGRQSDTHVATVNDSLILIAKDSSKIDNLGFVMTPEQRAEFGLNDDDGNGPYRLLGLRQRGSASLRSDRPDMFFPVYVDPKTASVSLDKDEKHIEIVLPRKSDGQDGRWMWGKDKCLADGDRLVGKLVQTRGEWDVSVKDYLLRNGKERKRKFTTQWDDKAFNNQNGTTEVKSLMGGPVFQNPKPLTLLTSIVGSAAANDDLILDFFAGSGTTGHAVMAQNVADGGNRRYILVQLPEPLDPAKAEQKTAADFCDTLGKPRTIAELTKERLRRAGEKVKADNPEADIDTGFRVYKLSSSNLKPWSPGDDLAADLLDAAGNILPERSEEDLLVELLLKTGIDLTLPTETRKIAGCTVHCMGGGTLIVCLSDIPADKARALGDGIADWLAEVAPPAPTTFFFKDSGFDATPGGAIGPRSAEARANLAATLRQRLGKDGIEKLGAI